MPEEIWADQDLDLIFHLIQRLNLPRSISDCGLWMEPDDPETLWLDPHRQICIQYVEPGIYQLEEVQCIDHGGYWDPPVYDLVLIHGPDPLPQLLTNFFISRYTQDLGEALFFFNIEQIAAQATAK